jgi:hypothetical protein
MHTVEVPHDPCSCWSLELSPYHLYRGTIHSWQETKGMCLRSVCMLNLGSMYMQAVKM